MVEMFDYQAPAGLLNNKIILVTGASAGIGRVAAECFAQHGATVLLTGRNEQALQDCYDAITDQGYPEPAMFTLDLAADDPEIYAQVRDSIGSSFDRLDGILFNAGMLGERKPVSDYSAKVWQQVMQVNVHANFLLTQALLPLCQQAESSSLVYTSSSVGRKGRAYWGAYAVSKFALEGLMQIVADELQNTSSIRANSVNPGATSTAMRQAAFPAEARDSNPSAEQIMPIFLYLMGNDSLECTGQPFSARR